MSEILQNYGFFILVAIVMLLCHLGHRGHGGRGAGRDQEKRGPDDDRSGHRH